MEISLSKLENIIEEINQDSTIYPTEYDCHLIPSKWRDSEMILEIENGKCY